MSGTPSTAIFRSSWSLYDAVLAANYMFHREIAVAIREIVRGLAERGNYTVLDLGCGNARGLAASMREAPPRRYEGVDLARPALDEAATVLRGLPEVCLVERDMLDHARELAAQGRTFDLIHSSFAMHHLSSADKAHLFRAMAGALAPGGCVLLVDVVRGADQTRAAYLETYLGTVEREWVTLSPDQVQEVRDHVSAFDFPETHAELTRMARDAGLPHRRVLGEFREHQVVLFRRTP